MMKPSFPSYSHYKKTSPLRRNLIITNLETIPAVILIQMLGGPFLTGYLLFLGATSEQIGWVLAVSSLVNVAQIFVALVMQRIRNRRLIIIFSFVLCRIFWLLAAWVPFIVPTEWDVFVYTVGFTIAFLCSTTGSIVWSSLIGDLVPAQVRGRYFGIRNAIIGAVGSVALFIGGQILDHFPGSLGFQYLFLIASGMLIINSILISFYPSAPFEPSTASNARHMMEKPLKDKVFLKAVLFLSVYLFLFNITVPFFNYVMLDILHMSYAWVSIVTVIHTVVIMISNYVWGNLNARIDNRTLVYYSLPFMALPCVLWGTLLFSPKEFVVLLVFIVLGIGVAGFSQVVFNYIIGDTPKTERPMYIAMYSAISGVFTFIGPIFGGWLYKQAKNYPDWVQTYGIAMVIGCLLLIFGFTFGRKVLLRKS
jgi:MFS family permease